MASGVGDQDVDLARQRELLRQDRYALGQIVRDHRTCEATGAPLGAENAVAMLVAVSPGVSRVAVVSGAHWDSGTGALSAADPDVDPDVLDGRALFAPGATSTRPRSRPQALGRQAPTPEAVPQPRRQESRGTGVVPRV